MEFKLKKCYRNASEQEMLSDLKMVADKLGKQTVTIEEYNTYGEFHSTTLTRRIGSWFLCLEKAGLKPSRSKINISEEELFQNLQNVWVTLGRQPKYHEVAKPLSKFSAGTYEHRYGSYYNALESFIKYVNGEDNQEIKSAKNSNKVKTSSNHKTQRAPNWRLRFLVLKRDNFKCVMCGRSPAKNPEIELHIDHIHPWSKGGETVLENLQTLCSVCNVGKSDL
jgi:5-methylcytosine-specific restriction endonuclease McrA